MDVFRELCEAWASPEWGSLCPFWKKHSREGEECHNTLRRLLAENPEHNEEAHLRSLLGQQNETVAKLEAELAEAKRDLGETRKAWAEESEARKQADADPRLSEVVKLLREFPPDCYWAQCRDGSGVVETFPGEMKTLAEWSSIPGVIPALKAALPRPEPAEAMDLQDQLANLQRFAEESCEAMRNDKTPVVAKGDAK